MRIARLIFVGSMAALAVSDGARVGEEFQRAKDGREFGVLVLPRLSAGRRWILGRSCPARRWAPRPVDNLKHKSAKEAPPRKIVRADGPQASSYLERVIFGFDCSIRPCTHKLWWRGDAVSALLAKRLRSCGGAICRDKDHKQALARDLDSPRHARNLRFRFRF